MQPFSVFAHEQLSNGWHVVVRNIDTEKDKEWKKQLKDLAYYENGIEMMRYRNFITAHRGWGEAPENSLASFKQVLENGFYGFETDVRFTKDNVAVLCHDSYINNLAVDNDLNSLTNSDKIYVKNLTYQELKDNYIFNIQRLNYTNESGNVVSTTLSEYNNNRITTLEETLKWASANKIFILLELKAGNQEQINSIVELSKKYNMDGNAMRWISFNPK